MVEGAEDPVHVGWGLAGPANVSNNAYCDRSPRWSPDGRSLAFSSDMDPTGAFHVYTISPEGGKPRCINQTKSAWPSEICWR